MTKLIVGLGNPGKEYEHTHHNIGFMVIDDYAKYIGEKFNKTMLNGMYFEFRKNNEKIILLKPLKYMNLSGEVVAAFARYYNIDVNDILIISDDLALDTGKIRLRPKGSSGGHNGLKNIELHLHTSEYKRLRIGIQNKTGKNIVDYVLSNLDSNETKIINSIFPTTRNIIDDFLTKKFDEIMATYN